MSLRADAVSVLVLDDHPFMQQVMRAILSGLGVQKTVPALDVDQALDLIKSTTFDLVIADYRLGAKSGAEFTRLVRGARGRVGPFPADHRLHCRHHAEGNQRAARCGRG
jgi:CheY-like chemotaxis protein